MKSKNEIYCLQAGRGIAACLVVLFHVNGLVSSPQYWNEQLLAGVFRFGHAGVEFFFVLSGFIMTLVHQRDIGRASRIYNYAIKRIARIYPLYWLVTLAVFALYFVSGNAKHALLYNSIFLIGLHAESVLAVGWTLFHEITFYIIFGILILNRKLGIVIFCIWMALCITSVWMNFSHYSLQTINVNFMFGILAGIYFNKLKITHVIMMISIFCFVAIGLEEVYVKAVDPELRSIMYGLASAFGIAAAVSAEKAGSISSPYSMRLLGDASYSLYLVHYPVIAIAAQIWRNSPVKDLPMPIAFVTLLAVALTAGLITHAVVERPIISFFNRRMAKRRVEPIANTGSEANIAGR
ncbi:acyltransferase family protein [Sphingomonas hankookensis]|uniref:acyltransferase family protein n=1 Tax=Sphingomonas hankookensis TaxID=563996 RepID=UPI003D3033BA